MSGTGVADCFEQRDVNGKLLETPWNDSMPRGGQPRYLKRRAPDCPKQADGRDKPRKDGN